MSKGPILFTHKLLPEPEIKEVPLKLEKCHKHIYMTLLLGPFVHFLVKSSFSKNFAKSG